MSLRQRHPRERNERHLDFIRSLACVCCGDNTATEAAHLRSAKREYGKAPTGGAEKSHDMWALPLCGRCHREQHTMSEEEFWKRRGLNPWVIALSLYAASGDYSLAGDVIENHARAA